MTVEPPIYRAWTKAIRSTPGPPKYSADWVTARRGWLNVFPDRLECGNTVIPVNDIREAVLYEARQWFIPVYVLAVTTMDGTWQFGLNPWTDIASHLPFPLRRERIRLKYSAFSIAIRIGLLAYLVYLLYRLFTAV